VTKKRRDRRPPTKPSTRPASASPAAERPDRAGSAPGREERTAAAALAVIVLVGAALRLSELFAPMDYDEAFTWVYFAARPLRQALSDYSLPNNHLFHTLLVHGAAALLGNRPWVLRLPALLAGLALLPVTYFLGRRLFGWPAGILAAALVACAPSLVDYSTNARGYTMVSLAFAGTLALAARILIQDRKRDWILLTAVSAAGLYTIPTMLYAFGGVVLWLLLEIEIDVERPRRGLLLFRALISVAATAALTTAAYAPIWTRSGWGVLLSKGSGSPSSPLFRTTMAASLADVWRQWNEGIPAIGAVLLGLAFLFGVIWHRRLSPYRISPALVCFLFPVLPLLFQRVVPFTRVWLYLLALYFATAAAALVATAGRLPAFRRLRRETQNLAVLALALLVVAGMGTHAYVSSRARLAEPARVDWICDDLAPQLQKGDLVAAHGYWATPIAYYLLRKDFAVERLATDWTLEVLQVTGVPKDATRGASSRPPRTFLVARAGDEPTLEAIRQKTEAAGATAQLTVLRKFGTTTVYEVGLAR
jgi:4-amino-4-deoxy-L-arabinose transferase-like glycosyltransferase